MSGSAVAGGAGPRQVKVTEIERHGIDTIPDAHRTSRPIDLQQLLAPVLYACSGSA